MSYSRRQLAKVLYEYQDTDKRAAATEAVAAYLVHEGRARELELVIRELESLANAKGRTIARVGSAFELDSQSRREIESLVKQLENSKDVELLESIDTSLLGGVTINTPEREVDVSVKGRLERMKG